MKSPKDFNDNMYISLSHKPQPYHNPQELDHRRVPRNSEKFRIYYTDDSKKFFMVCVNKKSDMRGFIGGAGDLLRIVNNHFKSKDYMELLFCHPTTFSKTPALQNLLNSNEQSLPKFLLLLT